MKKFCVFFLFLFYLIFSFADLHCFDFSEFDSYQNKLTYEEIDKKIKKYLEKDSEIRNFYQLTSQALYIGDLESEQIDYVLYLNQGVAVDSKRRWIQEGLKGAKIAIDPGHFGGEFAELEERCIQIPPSKTKNGEEIYFCEGDLTYLTAIELKRLLQIEGAEVFITRPGMGRGVLEEDFWAWREAYPDLKDENFSRLFREHYNRKDLKERAQKINAFSPDITIVIHYNSHLTATEKEAKEIFTQSNYNLAFIPGAFICRELKSKENRYEFLRLLLTDALEESLELSRYIVREFVDHLQVPLIEQNDSPSYIEKACLLQEQGIYSRNLVLTRLVHSPICYGETLIQNNEEEAYRLAEADIFIMDNACSKRMIEVAQAYFEGVKQYFNHF